MRPNLALQGRCAIKPRSVPELGRSAKRSRHNVAEVCHRVETVTALLVEALQCAGQGDFLLDRRVLVCGAADVLAECVIPAAFARAVSLPGCSTAPFIQSFAIVSPLSC